MDVTVAGTEDSIVMVEGDGQEISEKDCLRHLSFAHAISSRCAAFRSELAQEVGRPKRQAPTPEAKDDLRQ